jgi:hypothetical protein
MDAGAFHTYACAYRIDTVVIGFDGYFGPFAGYADDLLDRDQSVIDFRDFRFEEPFQE